MRARIRKVLGLVAVFVIALHTVLWAAVAPFAATAPIDPFTIVCHSEASGPADQAPANGAPLPAHACDHCNLCNSVAPPAAPDTALVVQFEPVRTLHVLRPVNIPRHHGVAADPRLARGPPAFA
jgi:hypothetical protein